MRSFDAIPSGLRGLGAVALVALLTGCSAGGDSRTVIASQHALSGAQAQVDLQVSGCDASDGASITLDGALQVDGIRARLIFTNNRNRFTHQSSAELATDLVVVPQGETLTIPTLTAGGEQIDDPYIFIRFVDEQGQPLSQELYLGHCSEGLSSASLALELPVEAVVFDSTRASCANHPGPEITLDAELSVGGATAQIILRDRAEPAGDGTPSQEVVYEQPLIATGKKFSFPKQPVHGGVGGNPWIFLELADGAGEPLGERTLLGRCVQLENGVAGSEDDRSDESPDEDDGE